MIYYFSGSHNCRELDLHMVRSGGARLYTFAYPEEVWQWINAAKQEKATGTKLMLDSGAFTAWHGGAPVTLDKLIPWQKRVIKEVGADHDIVLISLDVMPGRPGTRPTAAEIKHGMDESKANFETLQQEHDVPVLPVYHGGEPLELRDYYLERCDYYCLSMNQTWSEQNRVQWAREVHVDGVKTHGLAATGWRMLRATPWDSVDSASWIMAGAMGRIFWVDGGKLTALMASGDSPALKKRGQHIDTVSYRELLLEAVSRRGYDIEDLRADYRARWRWNFDIQYKELPPLLDRQQRVHVPINLF